jgi:hypothetical protein
LDFENNSNKPYAYVSLNIHIKDSNQDVLANTQLIRKPVITSPDKDYLTPVTLYSEDPFELTWWKDSVYYEAFIDFNYELYMSDQWIKKTVRFKYLFKPEMPEPFDTEHVQIVGDVFFEKLANKIKDDQPGDVRRFNSIDFAVQSSDPALYEYIKTTNADLDVELGSFSNVENGLGVFVLARKTELNGYPLDYRTLDSLRSGRFTRHLNFVAW